MSTAGFRGEWWLSTTGTPEGPYSVAFVRAGLRSGAIPRTAYACRVRGDAWKLVSEWDEFQDAALSESPAVGIRAEASLPTELRLTNPQFPAMANWICIYCIAISPVLFLIGRLSCFVTGASYKHTSDYIAWDVIEFLVGGVISLIATTLLVIGGLRLRSLRPSGPVLILTAMWFAIAAGFLLFAASLGVAASASDDDLAESTTAGTLFGILFLILGITEFGFLVASLIWLHRNRHSLPLTSA